jgi:hypothetical protein
MKDRAIHRERFSLMLWTRSGALRWGFNYWRGVASLRMPWGWTVSFVWRSREQIECRRIADAQRRERAALDRPPPWAQPQPQDVLEAVLTMIEHQYGVSHLEGWNAAVDTIRAGVQGMIARQPQRSDAAPRTGGR